MAMCAVETGAFAASARGTRGGGTAAPSAGAAPKANGARAAKMGGGKVANPGKSTGTTAGAKTTTGTSSAKPSAGKANGARAAATQKAIKVGTKVAVAVENTTISTECQNAYYGCMDAFCMMDNAAGGRCQCNDRITELDTVLAEIMKLEDEIIRIESEGVEKVEMGEYADQVAARTKDITNEFSGSGKGNVVSLSASEAKQEKKSRVLDLSSVKGLSVFDDDDEDIFATADNTEPELKIADDMANKKGDELHKAAARICTQQIPAQCKTSAAMLQQTYAQRVRSDCTGYANALTQSKQETSRKLMAAQQKVREAVYEAVKEQNKYTTQGECVAAFDKCMQTTAGCGADYTQCIADDTVLTMGTDGSKGTSTRADVQTSASAIGISANTLAMLTDKAPMCESVLKQCQNVRSGVWSAYLKMIVPTLKVAEVNAEENRRMDCIGNIVNCYTKACAAKWPNQESAEYDMCLSNPEIVGNLCQTQINKCSTGDTGEQVMAYVQAKLQALRVDACTNEVKQCLQSENNCGEGYVNCIGLDKDTIVKMCTNSATNFKLMACQSKFNNNQYEVQNYVAQVAQGLILNMDNATLKMCEEAGKKAMTAFCGSDTTCSGEKVTQNVTFNATDSLSSKLAYTYCPANSRTGDVDYGRCRQNIKSLVYSDIENQAWTTVLGGQLNFACFEFKDGSIDVNSESVIDLAAGAELTDEDKAKMELVKKREQANREREATPRFEPVWNNACTWGVKGMASYAEAYRIADILTAKVKNILGKIESDRTVQQCVMGRDLKGITTYVNIKEDDGEKAFDDMWTMKSTSGVGKGAFPNLMKQYRKIVADAVLESADASYSEGYDAYVSGHKASAEKDLDNRIAAILKDVANIEKANNISHAQNQLNCANLATKEAKRFNEATAAQRMRLNYNKRQFDKYWDALLARIFGYEETGTRFNERRADVETSYDKNNTRCKMVVTDYKCSKYEEKSDLCKGFFKDDPKTKTDYKKYSNIKSVDNTRYYN